MKRSIRGIAAALVLVLVAGPALAATPEQKCAAAKRKAIGKYVAGILNCLAKSVGTGNPVDSSCISKTAMKQAAAFTKAEVAGCATTGDFAALAGRAVAFIDAIDASLPTTPFPAYCFDAMKDGDETGVDCGGSCVPCL